jgi:tetratricopeptide (TPR) repeat protein
MKKTQLLVSVVAILLLLQPAMSAAAPAGFDYGKAYAAGDYTTAAQLLEQTIAKIQTDNSTRKSAGEHELYRLHLLLAHIYAWQLNRFDAALAEYQKAIDVRRAREQTAMQEMPQRQMPEQKMNIPTFEFLFIGGMYEQKQEYQRALEYYQKILPEAQAVSDNARDRDMAMIGQDCILLVQYQIDGMQLKLKPSKDLKPQLKKLNLLYSTNPQFFSLIMSSLLPDLEYAGTLAEKTGLQTFIKANPANIHAMLLEYIILSNVAGGSMSPSVQAALAAFFSKYPDGYFSLTLRHLVARYYKENGEKEKAKRYMAELTAIARSRNMELITEPDKRFATPEATWEVYRKALIAGDIEGALSCHSPGDTKYRAVLTKLGPETAKKMGKDMGPIHKTKTNSNDERAEYLITRKEGEQEFGYNVYFININGEWKIEQL